MSENCHRIKMTLDLKKGDKSQVLSVLGILE